MRRSALLPLALLVACAAPDDGASVDAAPTASVEAALVGGPPSPTSAEAVIDPGAYIANPYRHEPRHAAFNGRDWVAVVGDRSLVRIGADGTVRDRPPIVVDEPSTERILSLASDGETVAVAYAAHTPDRLLWQRYDRELRPVGAAVTIATATASDQSFDAALAFGDGRYLVAWTDRYENGDVRGTRIAADGQVLDATPFTIAGGGGQQSYPAAIWTGQSFVVAWTDGELSLQRIRAGRVLADGTVVDGGVYVGDGGSTRPRLAVGGGVITVAWSGPDYQSSDIRARRLSTSLALLDTTTLVLAGGPGRQRGVQLAWLRDSFLIAWNEEGGRGRTVGTLLPAAGAPGAPIVIQASNAIDWEPAVAAGGDQGLVLGWNGGTRVSATGALLDPQGITPSQRQPEQEAPALAVGGEGYLVAWIDERPLDPADWFPSPLRSIHAARLDEHGAPIDAAAIALPRTPGWTYAPAVGFDGRSFLVAWIQQTDDTPSLYRPRAVRVGLDGTVLDGDPLLVAERTQADSLAVAGSTDGFLVVWEESGDVYGQRVTTGGQRAGGVFPIAAAPGWQSDPAVVFDGESYVVAWNDGRPEGAGVRTARVTPAGDVLDLVGRVATSYAPTDGVSLAVGGGAIYAAWTRSDSTGYEVRGTRIAADGAPASREGDVLARNTRWLQPPSVAFDGASFVVTWARTLPTDLLEFSIDVARVRPSGELITGVTSLHQAAAHSEGVALASRGDGASIGVYAFDPHRGGEIPTRLGVRRFAPLAAGAVCSAAVACADGTCVDGVCCTSVCSGGTADCQACSRAAGAAADGTCGPIERGVVCRAATGACDASEVCDGEGAACPADAFVNDGTTCDDDDACSTTDRCEAGACVGSAPRVCEPAAACLRAGECDPETGACHQAPVDDGTACDDGDPCTVEDSCQSGACSRGAPKVCPPAPACHQAGVCQPATGDCVYDQAADGEPCDGGTCQAGACVPPVDAGADAAIDAGVDAGTADAAVPADARASDATPALPGPDEDGGCGCRSSKPASLPAACLLALGVAAIVRRGRRRAR